MGEIAGMWLVMTQPPSEIRLVATGERRYPESGEYYMWWDEYRREWRGPFIIVDAEDMLDWAGRDDEFAIYASVKMPEVHVEIGERVIKGTGWKVVGPKV